MNREEAIKWLTNEKWENANNKYKREWNKAFDIAIKSLNDELNCECCMYKEKWTEYSDKLWKNAYERGKAEALEQTCPQNDTDIGTTEPSISVYTEPSDLISRAEVHKVLSLLATEGGKDAKLLFSDAHESIDDLPSVSAERQPEPSAELATLPGSWLDDEDGTVICSECESEFYYGDDDELGDLFKQQRFCPECGHRMTDDDRWRISKQSILKRIIEQFEDHEREAKDKPHGLKEYAVWRQAAREVEEYMKARGYER